MEPPGNVAGATRLLAYANPAHENDRSTEHGLSGKASQKFRFGDEVGESGEFGSQPRSNDQPVIVMGGWFVDGGSLADLSGEFPKLKFDFFPGWTQPSD